ncbi:MAG: EamA family transporter RarD [Marinosulfonomonas sp.]
MTETNKGVLAMIGCCVIWGLSPIYYRALSGVPPLEVLSHRTLWSFVFFTVILLFQQRLRDMFRLFSSPENILIIVIAAVMISVNWFLFIYAVQIGNTVETSLGYYIFPLVAVLFGIVLFKERLSLWKTASVGLATLAVVILTVGLGVTPWISLALAFSFGCYGVAKKWSKAGPFLSVSAEVAVLLPLALIWLFGVYFYQWNGIAGRSIGVWGQTWTDTFLLMLAGPITALPLVMLSYATRRLNLTTVGLIQYLNPTLQFFCATVLFGETFTLWHAIAFALIWIALAFYSFDAIRQERAARKAAASSETVSKAVT